MAGFHWWDRLAGTAWRPAHDATARAARARRLVAWSVLPLVAACGGSPTSPGTVASSPAALQLSAGPYVLIVTGNSLTGGCSALSTGAIGLTAPVQVESAGGVWTVRPSAATTGDAVIAFGPSGSATPIAVGVAGTARGTLSDAGGFFAASSGVLMTIDGEATVTGEQQKGSRLVVGEMRGSIRFSEGAAPAVGCSRVSWSLGPAS